MLSITYHTQVSTFNSNNQCNSCVCMRLCDVPMNERNDENKRICLMKCYFDGDKNE